MKIISYNLNGIRSAQRKGFDIWATESGADLICIQENKAQQNEVELAILQQAGYKDFWYCAEKKGYSGVTIFSKKDPIAVTYGCGIPEVDREGRIIRLDFEEFSVLNCYFPSGTTGDERQGFKMVFLDQFLAFIDALKKTHPKLIVVGDYNIAHTEMDIHNPKGNKTTSGFLPEERAWMDKWFASGFVDAFRACNSSLQKYSWWSFRANSRANNKGWRIDYISITDNLKPYLLRSDMMNEVEHSDHCPVWAEFDFAQ